MRLRYTTALVSGFAVFMLIALSYVVGRHIGRGPQSASAADSSDIPHLMQQPPQAGVTAVSRQRQSTSQGGTPTTAQPATPTQPRHAIDSSPRSVKPRQAAAVTSLVPASAETGMPRAVGLNYVIIGTYPPEMRQNAEAARDYFTRNGIPCTIERTEYVRNPNWVCLVGTAGFTKVSAPDFEDYTANIRELAAKMTSSRFDRPDPHGYKWKGTETP